MAHWASSQDDEQQQGAGDSNTPINHIGPSSNDEIPHPLMDCGQGKNNTDNNDPATGQMPDEVGVGVDVVAVGVGVVAWDSVGTPVTDRPHGAKLSVCRPQHSSAPP